MASLLPTPEPPDPVEGALGHFEHTNWVKQALKNLDAGTVHSVGGATSGGLLIDGTLTVNPTASETSTLVLQGDSTRVINGTRQNGSRRWQLFLGDATAESGAHSGSLFGLLAYGDDGSARATVLEADRASGLVKVTGPPTVPTGVATKQYVDDAMPLGAIVAYGGAAAPTGWHICNGTAHGSAALQNIIGSPNTPDLSGRFIIGTGTGYNPKATGGLARVTLSAAESGLPGHTHLASSIGETQEHTHGIDPPATATGGESTGHLHSGVTGYMNQNNPHTHDAYTKEGITTGDSDTYIDTADAASPASNNWNTVEITATDINHTHSFTTGDIDRGHTHVVDIAPFTSWGRSSTHTHGITVSAVTAAAASASHENLPPYYALIYIIKKV